MEEIVTLLIPALLAVVLIRALLMPMRLIFKSLPKRIMSIILPPSDADAAFGQTKAAGNPGSICILQTPIFQH